ncbi:MAG: hypothetical protein H3Z52_12970 [archaeon]|nr:hypothetical protein [archaeon]
MSEEDLFHKSLEEFIEFIKSHKNELSYEIVTTLTLSLILLSTRDMVLRMVKESRRMMFMTVIMIFLTAFLVLLTFLLARPLLGF